MPGYPIELDLREKTAIVVGLGMVGLRKAAGLLAAGARVIGVDPVPRRIELPEAFQARYEPYRPEHLQGACLAIAAATPGVNRLVTADAKRLGIWVNSASEPAEGDFSVPSVWRDGPILLTVSTSGAGPALANLLRDRAAESLGTAAAGFAALLAELRPEAIARIPDADSRRKLLADWGHPRWLELWENAGPETVRDAMRRAIEDAAGLNGFTNGAA